MAKVLVTGGAGFIGSNLVDRLLELGNEVSIVDNLLTGRSENLNHNAKFYESDITNQQALREIFEKEKPEYVFHVAAGYLVQSIENPQRDAMINIIGSINVIQESLRANVSKVIYSNSGGASYGEPQFLPITEEHPVVPTTPYGISKHTAEHYFWMNHLNHGLNFTSLRYANIYGPRQDPKLEGGVVSIFVDSLLNEKKPRIFGDGLQTRDYCYVDDVVDANILAMTRGDSEACHVATGIETNVLEMYNLVKRAMNIERDYIPDKPRLGDCRRAVFDISKTKRILGWSPKTSLESGIRKTIEWQKQQRK